MKLIPLIVFIFVSSLSAEVDTVIKNERKEILPDLELIARWSEGSELLQVIYKKKQIFVLSTSEGNNVYVESFPGNELFCSYQKAGEDDLFWLCITKQLSDTDSFQIYITKEGTNTYHVFSDISKISNKKKVPEPSNTTFRGELYNFEVKEAELASSFFSRFQAVRIERNPDCGNILVTPKVAIRESGRQLVLKNMPEQRMIDFLCSLVNVKFYEDDFGNFFVFAKDQVFNRIEEGAWIPYSEIKGENSNKETP